MFFSLILYKPDSLGAHSLHTMEGEWHEFEAKRERARKRRRVDA